MRSAKRQGSRRRSIGRFGSPLLATLLGSATPATAQQFGFPHHMLSVDGGGVSALALGDFEGDGDLDLLVGRYGGERFYSNDGIGVFTAVGATTILDNTAAVALGDVDGDGDLDAFVGNEGQQNRLFLNAGGGAFTDSTGTNLPPLVGPTSAVALGDIDGDGDLDAFVAYDGAQSRLLLNGGTGIFADVTGTNIPPLVGPTSSVALGDLDADGDLDVFLGSPQQNRLLRNLGGMTAVFLDVTATSLPILAELTQSVALGDVDGDGDLDAFLGNFGQQSRLYLNAGTGSFLDATATNLPAFVGGTVSVALADVEGDGDLDAFVGNQGPSLLLENGGTGIFTDATSTNLPSALYTWGPIVLGDVDAEGDLDLIAAGLLFLNDGLGVFFEVEPAPNLPAPAGNAASLALGDVDGDGDADTFVGSQPDDLRLLVNNGVGVFRGAGATNLPSPSGPSTKFVLGDVDGDADLDVLVGNGGPVPFPQPPNLYLNDGTGVYVDASSTNLPASSSIPVPLALADVDGDGDLDAFAATSIFPSSLLLFSNGGAGVFTDVTATSLQPTWAGPFAVRDLDGDGDLDAWVTSLGGTHQSLRNNGAGVFTTLPATSFTSVLVSAVALGDVDGDGDLDALLGAGSYNGEADRLLLNTGNGNFTAAPASYFPYVPDATAALALGDVDEDGDLDALLANALLPNRLLMNTGTGVFFPSPLPATYGPTTAVALGDLDGDADLDAFLAKPLLYRTLINLTRQLSWRGIPRVGKPLSFDLRGPANGAWLLGASAFPAAIPLPPLGTLRLDPSTLLLTWGGGFDSLGRGSVTFAVPPSPALVGGSVYWQALVGPPPRFANLEITMFTNL